MCVKKKIIGYPTRDYFCIEYKNILVDISKEKSIPKIKEHNPITSFGYYADGQNLY